MGSITYHKGLLNGPGQNNCFLNSAVQVLWHVDIFRQSFQEFSGHACMSDACIFCALKDLFGQLQYSHERALPPDALRKALAESFSDQHRFQLGCMDDAAECFENILLRIHFHVANSEAEDMCSAKHCIPHQKFAMTLVEQSVCSVCYATSEPLPFTQMVHYVSASALISQSKQIIGASHANLFGQLLKNAGGMGDIRDCPSSCGAKIQIRRTLINRPQIVSVGIVWDSDHPTLELIMSLFDTLCIQLRLSDVFHGSFDFHHNDNVYHQLVGVVTYYGKHYSTFFFQTQMQVWVYFDDANVREVGPHWEQVVEMCRRGRYQPLLLLFAAPNGTPVDVSNAPKTITLVDKPKINMRSAHDVVRRSPIHRNSMSPIGGLSIGDRRSVTPNPLKPLLNNETTLRRSITPNPDQSERRILSNNDYQNLAYFQKAVFNRSLVVDERALHQQDFMDKYKLPVRANLIRRDSGNWSGDRNSASSSSSTSLENPCHYIIGKTRIRNHGEMPKGPNKGSDLSSGSGNSSGGHADPGYDSFSLSSTDSLPIQQNLKHNFQLAQIPEGNQIPPTTHYKFDENSRVEDDCERLCIEVDQLLYRSEHTQDLITALSLCNAAVNKARAAMDAPYSNPQTASFATMKHNACVLRARSLTRKLEEPLHNNLKYGEVRHSREGSGGSARGSSGTNSRHNSKDKDSYSRGRQNNQDLLDIESTHNGSSSKTSSSVDLTNGEKLSSSKNIEIYATLPKNKKDALFRSSTKSKTFIEDEEYLIKGRSGRRTQPNRSKMESKKEVERRARSEDRSSKNTKEMITSVVTKETDTKKESKQEEKQNKKQHKIRRKLFMGGLIRRKNRSMPDLREDESVTKEQPLETTVKEISKDDLMVDSKTAIQSKLNGYLSEGNLEYAGNPNLERSKLMRKNFHYSKILQSNKVPPPTPLRTTSQLSNFNSQLNGPKTNETVVYANQKTLEKEPSSLPYLSTNFASSLKTDDAILYSNGGILPPHSANTIVTEALIHQEAPSFQSVSSTVNQKCKAEEMNFKLPPYPSPVHLSSHSRQASEEFPPPPAMFPDSVWETNFAAMLQEKHDKLTSMYSEDGSNNLMNESCDRFENDPSEYRSTVERQHIGDLKSKFEQLGTDEVDFVCNKGMISSVCATGSSTSRKSYEVKNKIDGKRKNGKKKNVTFCEQVVLVATADEAEADGYISNPIFERVLRSIMHKETGSEMKEHMVHSVVPLKRTDSWKLSQGLPLKSNNTEKDLGDFPFAINEFPRRQQFAEGIPKQTKPEHGICDHVHTPPSKPFEVERINNSSAETYNSETNSNSLSRHHESSKYSPVCNGNPLIQNNYLTNMFSTCQQNDENSFGNSYNQFASLQYCSSANTLNPQVQYRDPNAVKNQTSSLPRQYVGADHHNLQVSIQDPRRMPVTNMPQNTTLESQNRPKYGNRRVHGQESSWNSPYECCNNIERNQNLSDGRFYGYNSNDPLRGVPYSNNFEIVNNRCAVINQPFNNINQSGILRNGSPNVLRQYSSSFGDLNSSLSQYQILNQVSPSNEQSQRTLNDQFGNNVPVYQYSPNSNRYLANGVPTQNKNCGHQPHYYPENSFVATHPRNPVPVSSYQSIPHNSPVYESHSFSNSSMYQNMPHSYDGIPNFQPASKFSSPQRGNLPSVYQPPPVPSTVKTSVYQRVPTPNQQLYNDQNPFSSKYVARQSPKKAGSGCVPCNLCRQKQILPPAIYCNDCDSYISHFKSKT